MVTAQDVHSVLGSYFHEHFPDGLARWKLWKVHKNLWGLTTTSLREVPWEGRIQPGKPRLLITGGRHFEVQECTMRSAAATDSKTPQRCHAPSLYIPWQQLKWLPQLQGTELAQAETSPTQQNWVFWGSVGNTIKPILLQRKSAGISSFCPSTANNRWSRFNCAWWLKTQTQQHPSQSRRYWVGSGCWATEQMLWQLLQEVCQLPSLSTPTYQESPLEVFFTTLFLLFKFSYVPAHTHAHTHTQKLVQLLCSSTALPGSLKKH